MRSHVLGDKRWVERFAEVSLNKWRDVDFWRAEKKSEILPKLLKIQKWRQTDRSGPKNSQWPPKFIKILQKAPTSLQPCNPFCNLFASFFTSSKMRDFHPYSRSTNLMPALACYLVFNTFIRHIQSVTSIKSEFLLEFSSEGSRKYNNNAT